MGFEVYESNCNNCLLSKDSIVSPDRRKEIISSCLSEDSHFICHKSSINGGNVCCKSFYDKLGHRINLIRIAGRLGVIKFVPLKDNEKLTPYRETKNLKNERNKSN